MTRRPDQIDWSALSHAYGSAEDIPEAIEALADPERVESAVDSFYDALLHQQSIYSATGPAVVAAARMIVEGRCADPEDAGEMLLYFAQLTDHWRGLARDDPGAAVHHPEVAQAPACRAALDEVADILLPVVAGAGAAARTAAAIQAYRSAPDARAVAALAARIGSAPPSAGEGGQPPGVAAGLEAACAWSLAALGADAGAAGLAPRLAGALARVRTRACGREDLALLAEHWPRARELVEELVVGEEPAHWLIDVNAEAAAAVLCAPPALGDGDDEVLIDLVRASRGATPRVVEHIAALAADPGADPEPLIAVLEETPITPEVCDIAAALADRPAGAPRSRGWTRPDHRLGAARILAAGRDPRWARALEAFVRASCLERATWAKIGGHWALEPIGPLTGAGLSPGAGLVAAVTERLRGRTERTDVSRLLALLAGWPPDECRDALETVRGLLPRTAAVRVLTAWRDLESLPALRRAAADGGLYERFMVARMTRDLRDYHRVLDAGPDESCLPELIASWPEPGDPRLVELCRRLCRIPDDARPPAQRARVAAMAGLVEAGDDVGRHLPALLSLIAADPRVFDAQALLRRWRREGRLGADDVDRATPLLAGIAADGGGVPWHSADGVRATAALTAWRVAGSLPEPPAFLARILAETLSGHSKQGTALDLAESLAGAPAGARAAVVAELSRQVQRDQRLSTMDAAGDEELLARMRRAVALLGDGAAVSGREP
ncbi:hypothetical protein [Actinomyces dentalis]|uniref:hypothetical protein n=1 Tax=Actinomyces dentalis TaxID=272548 RepID=UPI0028EC384D|nr:hypothetical protein [Actinomyces dentalis]